jgi:hypothetical protein
MGAQGVGSGLSVSRAAVDCSVVGVIDAASQRTAVGTRTAFPIGCFAAEVGGDAATTAGRDVTTYYPPNRGFLGASARQTLEAGTRIDRYGGEGGFFASPEGTPAAMRALRPGTDLTNLNTYEVVLPFEVDAGTAAPWFGQLGLGTQYELPSSVADLLDSGLLKAVR